MPDFPYRLIRAGVVLRPDPEDPNQVEGVLNPAAATAPDGRVLLLPRLVAAGNVSRIGLVELRPDGAGGLGCAGPLRVVLAPDAPYEHGPDGAGVEDPRVTYLPRLGRYVMAYVAFGPAGPRAAFAVSDDLLAWRRLGPVRFTRASETDPRWDDLPNKDVVVFPDPVRAPDGSRAYAVLHRPMWQTGWDTTAAPVAPPAGVTDPRPGIWVSFADADAVERDVAALGRLAQHRPVALPAHPFERQKIGAGAPPIRVPEGYLLLHHGVGGDHGTTCYSAGALVLSPDPVWEVRARTAAPLLTPELAEERHGTVADVVFPTAVVDVAGSRYALYGMADSCIGAARVERVGAVDGGAALPTGDGHA